MTRLEVKENLNDKKRERVERIDEWMKMSLGGGGGREGFPIYRFEYDLLEEMCLLNTRHILWRVVP